MVLLEVFSPHVSDYSDDILSLRFGITGSGSPEVPGADVARASAPYRGGTPSCSKLLEDV